MLFRALVLAALVLAPARATAPEEAKGLQVLWVPKALALTSGSEPGFQFRHPATQVETTVSRGRDLESILKMLPAGMKSNGVWISTSNSFLYSKLENAELAVLVRIAKSQKIPLFICQLLDQPQGWQKLN